MLFLKITYNFSKSLIKIHHVTPCIDTIDTNFLLIIQKRYLRENVNYSNKL